MATVESHGYRRVLSDLPLPAAVAAPQAAVTYWGGSTQSYSSLLDEARRILGGLRSRGLRAGARIGLVLERPCDFIPCFWAAVLGGFLPCPVAPVRGDRARWRAELEHVNDLLDEPLFIVTKELSTELPHVDGASTALLEELSSGTPDMAVHRVHEADPALLML